MWRDVAKMADCDVTHVRVVSLADITIAYRCIMEKKKRAHVTIRVH